MDVMDDPKAKKKALLHKRNKRNFILRKMMEDKERENKRAEEDEQKKLDSLEVSYSVPGVTAGNSAEQVAQIKNRITGKKRASKERWNRFAGTSGSGGRGL